jgi:acetyl-CoA synthetase
MTRGFWGDDGSRYLDTYWSRIPDLWVHGDWAQIDADGYWYILGRSDDTIKVAGKRVGPAEVESAAVAHGGVLEAAAIGVPDPLKGETIVVFVIPRPGRTPDAALRAEIEARIVHDLGKTLKPEAVRFVTDLPRTRNAKILRRLVRRAYLGEPLGDASALENPAALEAIQGARIASSPTAPRTGAPVSSTTSAAMPGTGALKQPGLSGRSGRQQRMPPEVSVPPE